MGKSFTIRRSVDGLVYHDNELPDEISVPMGWFENGGIEGVMRDKALIDNAIATGEYGNLTKDILAEIVEDMVSGMSVKDALVARLSRYNLEPLFERDGMDMVFTFENHGPVRYSFVGFMSNPETGALNPDALMFTREAN